MTESLVLQVVRDALLMVIILSVPVLAAGTLVGLVVSILQATTQIQEQSLSFIPKLVAVVVTLIIIAPWVIKVITGYTVELYAKIPMMLK